MNNCYKQNVLKIYELYQIYESMILCFNTNFNDVFNIKYIKKGKWEISLC